MKLGTLLCLQQARAARRPAALATWLASGEQRLFHAGDDLDDLAPPVAVQVRAALGADRSGSVQTEAGRVFVQAYSPGLRLLVVGAVHIAQALAPMAALAGFAVTVIDPRRAFAADHRFADVTVDTRWPDEALQALAPDARTAVITLTHDPKLDDPALRIALASTAFYIGSLGSRRTHAARLERLRAAGLDEPALARIHGPAGLPIGALSPAEIATAILAEVIATLRHASATAAPARDHAGR